jgi:hypothetical protein
MWINLGGTLAPDERVKLSEKRLQHPAPWLPSDAGAVSSAYVERAMKFLSLGDFFLVSALTGTIMLVEMALFIVVGMI